MMKKINYTKPSITQLEIDYANDAVSNGWGDKCNQYIERFESLFKSYLNREYLFFMDFFRGYKKVNRFSDSNNSL